MKTIKQYINNNKHLLIMFCTTTFLMLIYSVAFCNPVVLMTLLPSVANKFIDKAFEVAPYFADKAIAATPYVAYGTGWIVVGSGLTLAGIKTIEYGYNWRYIANQTTNSIPIVGWTASGLQWGYEKITGAKIKSVEYTYFLPKIASVLGDPNFFTKKIVFDLNTQSVNFTTDKDMVREVEVVKYEFIDRVEKQIEYINRTVYVPAIEYRDRENLIDLEQKVETLTNKGQDIIFLQQNLKSQEELILEILSLQEHENAPCLNLKELQKKYHGFKMAGATHQEAHSPTPIKLKHITFFKQQERPIIFYFENIRISVELTKETFMQKYPTIYSALDFTTQLTNTAVFLRFNYSETRNLLSTISEFNPGNCVIENDNWDGYGQDLSYNLLDQMRKVQLQNLETEFSAFNALVENLADKIAYERRLITSETQNQSTQTSNFDLNETIYDRITSFLEVRDETSFNVASNDGRTLPFNNMQIQSYKKPQETVGTQTQETSIETQTVPFLSENVSTLGISTLNSSLFQQMGTFFGTVLVGAVVHDFQTLDLVARSILGFIHIPEYNQAFIAATQMSIADLQMTYNFGFEEAQKAYQSIEIAKELRVSDSLPSDLSSQLSDSNDYFDQAQKATNAWGIKEYLVFTSVLVLAGGTLYFMYQSIKTGTPIENGTIQSVSPSVDAWKNTLINKVNKL